MKILEILQKILLKEQEGSDPKNPDVYPDQDEWGMDDAWTWGEWKIYYNTILKKFGESKAKSKFLKYWEVVEEGIGVVADNDMEPNWFKEKNMWNSEEDRPYTQIEFDNQFTKKEKKPIEINKNLKDGSTLRVSPDDFFNHLKKNEGIRKNAYADSGGVWTIGYGHTGGVKPGQVATDEQIKNWLLEDIAKFEKCVTDIMKSWKEQGLKTYMITQGQFDSMVSFAFNAGCGGLRSTKFLQLTKEGKYNEAAEMMKTEKIRDRKGEELAGLKKRRNSESNLYLS